MSLRVREGLLREILAMLRSCGARERECVVYWTGPHSDGALADCLLHPVHRSRADFYEIDPAWLHRTFVELACESRAIRAQVHTHRGRAFHSRTDDGFPVVQTAGFLSLVIPDFASRNSVLDGTYLARLEGDGSFREVEVTTEIEVVS